MKRLVSLFFCVSLFFTVGFGHVQEVGKIVYQLDLTDNGQVQYQLKWYHKSLIRFDEGCRIYMRTSASSYVLISEVYPLPELAISDSLTEEEKDELLFFKTLLEGDLSTMGGGFALFNVYVKSFQSNSFSAYLGNYYRGILPDTAVQVQFKVSALRFGREVVLGETAMISVSAALSEVAFPLEAVEQHKKVQFSWVPDDDSFYCVNIYRRKAEVRDFKKINKQPILVGLAEDSTGQFVQPEAFYEDLRVSEDSAYIYYAAPVGYFEAERRRSADVRIQMPHYTPPGRAIGLDVDLSTDNKVMLTWRNPPDSTFQALYVYRATASEGPYVRIHGRPLAQKTQSYEDRPSAGSGYYYYIGTVGKGMIENRSNKVFVDVPDVAPPKRPVGVHIRSDTGRVMLSWQANDEVDLMGYQVFRSINDEKAQNFVLLNAHPIQAVSFTDSLPENASNYFLYKIKAVDSAYNRSAFSEAAKVQLPDVTAPNAPFIYDAEVAPTSVTILWKASVDPHLMGYYVYMCDSSGAGHRVTEDLVTGLSYEMKAIEEGRIYVTALDENGNESVPSNTYILHNHSSRPISFNPEKLTVMEDKEQGNITLRWVYKGDTEHWIGGIVYRKTEGKDFEACSGLLRQSVFKDGLIEGGCQYKIRAFDKDGQYVDSEILVVPN